MFKNKITNKLSLYFTISLTIFALVIGSVFILLFRSYSINLNKSNLKIKAVNIAETIPNFLEKSGGGVRGFGMYLNVINEIEEEDIWIIDSELNLIVGQNRSHHNDKNFVYADIPDNASSIVSEVFLGDIVFSEDFSSLLTEPSLTIGVPIVNSVDNIIGVVLLHSPIYGVNQTIIKGIGILIISILLALVVAFGLAYVLSKYFTKPLVIMNKTALQLVDGDYQAKNEIIQDDEIGQLANTLDTLAVRLEKANQESEKLEIMRREFIANISHELKTPVTVMRGSLEALVDEVVSDPILVKEYYKQMLNESKFLERLIKDLLELSKLQSLDFKIIKKEISICDVIDDVIRSVSPLAKNKNILINVEKDDNCLFYGDYGRIRQMLLIVVENAIKFSYHNSEVEVFLENSELFIKDKGVGIKEEDLPYIFDRFQKSRSEENKTGTGLGLAISKNIAIRHGIELTVTSTFKEGTLFKFDLKPNKTS